MKLFFATALSAIVASVSATDYQCDVSVQFQAKNNVIPTTPDMVWATDVATDEGYNIKLDGNSFKKFIVQHATAGIHGGNRQLSSVFDYNAQGVAGIVCRWCGHPDDDRRLSESVSLAQELIQSEEFKKFENAFCSAIINKGEYYGASGCRVAIDNCEEGSAVAASAVQNYLVKDMRAAPQDGVVFVLENGN
ncbi:hypothetical protein IV203_012020 [Nitzschia inconspicua]|uniref:Uncharacterized protein n=1 Tax=Nitzschia inconspicua TaxID=303405 RepID=A0A9K3PJB8_9STRA|nr:hypothetical protein IV203_012020 [Nitzschia inconspicua]